MSKNKHNAELQRTDPDTKDTEKIPHFPVDEQTTNVTNIWTHHDVTAWWVDGFVMSHHN